jgi:hypothetical protein
LTGFFFAAFFVAAVFLAAGFFAVTFLPAGFFTDLLATGLIGAATAAAGIAAASTSATALVIVTPRPKPRMASLHIRYDGLCAGVDERRLSAKPDNFGRARISNGAAGGFMAGHLSRPLASPSEQS